MVMSCVLLLPLGYHTAEPPPTPPAPSPTLPDLWSAQLSCKIGTNGSCGAGMEAASFFYDSRATTLRQRLNSSLLVYWLEGQGGRRKLYSKYVDECRPMPLNFTFGQLIDFSWMPLATCIGAHSLFYSDAHAAMNYTVQLDPANGLPTELDVLPWLQLPGTPEVTPQVRRWSFTMASAGVPQPTTLWNIPRPGCLDPLPPCADSRPKQRFHVYIAHPHQFVDLANQDSGDARGDVAFLCPDLTSDEKESNGYDTVSMWVVDMDVHWGQYRQCNGYPGLCIGLEGFFVGRQVPFGDPDLPLSGQCSLNAARGSWFSHPTGGRCPSEASANCSWWPLRRVKSVAINCLKQLGFVAACKEDLSEHGALRFKEWIYNRSMPIFEAAFASDEAVYGGCPSIQFDNEESN
eukprot:CAMPEP_0119312938 /NCGR_PEP_ID=MMETSP1333-20130426/27296_1 /TAXON_ID=418940 /ORGANISM="Scyphosphaera apsteinii, Strain RCC1455" /LENGTH=403 /DNA_ID=CAMNT_0007317641 /DNA_START=66 /DNA_END=1277 /DNA_ORIENTATION=-